MKYLLLKKNCIQKIILAVLLFLFLPIFSHAQGIDFEASINRNKVALGASMQLTLTVTGTQDAGPIDLPSIDGMEVRYLGPSTRISFVNGVSSSSIAHIYTLIPLKIGKFHIPSISITISGKTYTTKPIDIKVVDQGNQMNAQPDQGTSSVLSLKDKVFLTIETSKETVYLNEKNFLIMKLHISNVSLRDIQLPELEFMGFTVDEFQEPKRYQEIIGGTQHQVIEFKTFIYPTRTGKLSVGPAKLKSNVLIRSTERRRRFGFGGLDSFFDDDFFGGLFDRHQKHPITVESNNLTINVLPLPEQGKPKNFSGAVGRFDFEVSASPTEIKVGDPVTLRMKVQGDGSLKAVTMPSLEASDKFKIYDPQIKIEGGIKTLEQVVIPKTDKVTQIHAIEFSYFDVEDKRYKTKTGGPFSLKIKAQDEKEMFKVFEFDDEKKVAIKEKLGRDIIFIKDQPGRFSEKNNFLYRNNWFFLLVFTSIIVWLSVFIVYLRTHKLKTDVVYARRLRAPKQAKKGLSEARRFMEQEQQIEFYNAIFKTMQEYFGNKFHLPSGGVTVDTVKSELNTHKVERNLLENIETVFAECDLIRYASVDTDEMKMRNNYKNTEEIIDYMERHIK